MSFYEFMIENYINNETPLGDFARDMRDDKKIPHNNNEEILRYLNNKITDDFVLQTLEEAEILFRIYKEEK